MHGHVCIMKSKMFATAGNWYKRISNQQSKHKRKINRKDSYDSQLKAYTNIAEGQICIILTAENHFHK